MEIACPWMPTRCANLILCGGAEVSTAGGQPDRRGLIRKFGRALGGHTPATVRLLCLPQCGGLPRAVGLSSSESGAICPYPRSDRLQTLGSTNEPPPPWPASKAPGTASRTTSPGLPSGPSRKLPTLITLACAAGRNSSWFPANESRARNGWRRFHPGSGSPINRPGFFATNPNLDIHSFAGCGDKTRSGPP